MMPPKIDNREKNDLINQMRKIVPFYTPEWRFTPEDPDPGSTLFLIFAEMFMGNVKRMNRVPLKHFVGFLNMFDVSLNTAQSATAYITFQLTNGAKDPVFVAKGTKVSAQGEEDAEEDIIFETADHLLITPAKIAAIFKACPIKDCITKIPESISIHTIDQVPNEPVEIGMYKFLEKENEQEHSIYIGHYDFFTITSTVKIEVAVHNPFQTYKDSETAKLLSETRNVDWYYYANDEWHPFDKMESFENKIILYKTKVVSFAEKDVHDTACKWIKGKIKDIKKGELSEEYSYIEFSDIKVKTDYYDVDQTKGFLPDLLFNDDIHLDENKGFYPFNDYFVPSSNFYISTEEAFSKKGSRILLTFHLKSIYNHMKTQYEHEIDWKLIMKESDVKKPEVQNITIHNISWEYWNGNSWVLLPMDSEFNEIFTSPSEDGVEVTVEFHCPVDIEKTFVNSHFNYWIRARINHIDHILSADVMYHSPWIDSLRIAYDSRNNFQQAEQCITYNNLQYSNQTDRLISEGLVFQPFSLLDSKTEGFYLGFDQAPAKGPISIFFNLVDFNFAEEEIPFIEWEYLRKNGDRVEWTPLKVRDNTSSLTRSGEIRLVGPADFVKYPLFSEVLYWIRIVNYNQNVTRLGKTPTLKSIHINTSKVVQQITIENENPIEIEEGIEKIYQLANYPVLSEEVWVDESGHLSEEEINELVKEDDNNIHIIRDTDQNIQRCWIKWEAVNQFFDSSTNDRHYVMNYSLGKIYFGNGIHGKRPSDLTMDKILVNYKIGGGRKGNVPRHEITSMQSAIPFVHSIINFEPGGGGSDQEKLESALIRGPKILQHRYRAVTAEDFEWLVREASQNIAKVKCISNYNSLMEKEVGCITIVILPESNVDGLQSFPEIKARVEKYILSHTAINVAFSEKIQIIKPAFLEVSLSATVVVEDVDMLIETEMQAIRKLNEFLDPLTGNFDRNGWEIGQQIHISVFYALLKSIRHVNYVDRLYMTVYKIENGERQELDITEIIHVPHGIVVNGAHNIKVKVL